MESFWFGWFWGCLRLWDWWNLRLEEKTYEKKTISSARSFHAAHAEGPLPWRCFTSEVGAKMALDGRKRELPGFLVALGVVETRGPLYKIYENLLGGCPGWNERRRCITVEVESLNGCGLENQLSTLRKDIEAGGHALSKCDEQPQGQNIGGLIWFIGPRSPLNPSLPTSFDWTSRTHLGQPRLRIQTTNESLTSLPFPGSPTGTLPGSPASSCSPTTWYGTPRCSTEGP